MTETQPTPIAVIHEDKPTLETSPKTTSSSAPKWELTARERMKTAIKKFSKPLADLVARDANEGDTRLGFDGRFNRFAIGFVIGAASSVPAILGSRSDLRDLVSLPDGIITKTYAPILILGAVGGVIIRTYCWQVGCVTSALALSLDKCNWTFQRAA